MKFLFDYEKFRQGYFSYAHRVLDSTGNQLGVYRVQAIEDSLAVSFFRNTQNDEWRKMAPIIVTRYMPLAVPLVRSSLEGLVHEATAVLYEKVMDTIDV
jgi:hypothetical protein